MRFSSALLRAIGVTVAVGVLTLSTVGEPFITDGPEANAAAASPDATKPPGLGIWPRDALAVPPLAPPAADRFYRQNLEWSECGEFEPDAECAQLTVPLDYERPHDFDAVTVELIRLPATDPDRRIGSLVVNYGGPGISGVWALDGGGWAFAGRLRRHFDIVSFDPRGVINSTPVACTWSDERPGIPERLPDDPAGRRDLVAEFTEFAGSCRRLTPDGLIGRVGTRDVARDLDVLRGALGDRRLTYIGYSYGTLIGAEYAQMFPQRTGRLVLDAAIDPTLSAWDYEVEAAIALETGVTDFLAWCVESGEDETDGPCSLGTGTPAVAEAGLRTLIADLNAEPLPTGADWLLDGQAVVHILTQAAYSPDMWPEVETALYDVVEFDDPEAMAEVWDVLIGVADSEDDDDQGFLSGNYDDANLAVHCLDRPAIAPDEWGDLKRELSRVTPITDAPLFLDVLTCPFWPRAPTRPAAPIKAVGSPPILVVGSTGDPATPYAWSVRMAEDLDSGVLLTRHGPGHTGFRMGDDCVDRAVEDYLLTGALPAAGGCDPADRP